MKNTIQCPVSLEKVDENATRIVAALTLVIASLGLYFNDWRPFFLLAVNFATRAFTAGHFSPLKFVAKNIADQLGIAKKPVDAEPKKFAAALGMVFSIFIIALQFPGFQLAANVVGLLLISCATLEAGFGICVGCVAYSYTILPFYKNSVQEI